MPETTIEISPESAQAAKDAVAAGHYPDESTFIDAAIARAMAADREKLERLNAELAKGIAQADRGEYSTRTIDDIITEAKARKAKKNL